MAWKKMREKSEALKPETICKFSFQVSFIKSNDSRGWDGLKIIAEQLVA